MTLAQMAAEVSLSAALRVMDRLRTARSRKRAANVGLAAWFGRGSASAAHGTHAELAHGTAC